MDLRRRRKTFTLKWLSYGGLAYGAAILQGTPGLFSISGIKPLFLIPTALAVAAAEGEQVGALFGFFCGLLWDLSAGRIAGFFAILVAATCYYIGRLFRSYLKQNPWNTMALTAGATFFLLLVDWFLNYAVLGLAGSFSHLLWLVLPLSLFTAVAATPFFWLVNRVHSRYPKE